MKGRGAGSAPAASGAESIKRSLITLRGRERRVPSVRHRLRGSRRPKFSQKGPRVWRRKEGGSTVGIEGGRRKTSVDNVVRGLEWELIQRVRRKDVPKTSSTGERDRPETATSSRGGVACEKEV